MQQQRGSEGARRASRSRPPSKGDAAESLRSWACTSDTAGGEDRLCSRIKSHVQSVTQSSDTGAQIEVRVAATPEFLTKLKNLLPFGTTVTADSAFNVFGFSTRFDDRVTVVTDAGGVQTTATFELKKVRRVVPTDKIGAQVWARTNLRDVTGLQEATTAAAFGSLTRAKTPAYMRTPTDGVLYNVYVDFATRCPAGFGVPTETELRVLASHYNQGTYTDKAAMVLAMKRELGIELGGNFVDGEIRPGIEAWWADGCGAALFVVSLDPNTAIGTMVANLPLPSDEDADAVFGVSVRLIRR